MGNVISMADFKSVQTEKGPFDKRLQGRILRMLNRSVELRASVQYLSETAAREEAVIAYSALRVEAIRLADKAGIRVIEADGAFRLEVVSVAKE